MRTTDAIHRALSRVSRKSPSPHALPGSQGGDLSVDVRGLETELRRFVEGEVRFDDSSRALYATDASNYRQVPIGVVIPRSIEDVIQTVRVCRKYGAPLLSRGGGTSLCGQSCNVAVVIDWMKYLHRVLEVDPGTKSPGHRRGLHAALRPSDEVHSLERAMSDGRSWDGNWKVRLQQRVRERGYDSLTAFAEAHPTLPLIELAQELGGDDLNAVQVFRGLVAEAERSHQVTRLVRGQLVRELCACLPDGWPATLDDANRFKVAKALGLWFGFTPETHRERVDQVSDALLTSPPPPGWRPLGPDDELLRTLLPDEEA